MLNKEKTVEPTSESSNDAKPIVIRSLPGGDDINSAADDYGFRVPYDGTNNFYDEIAIKHFLAGVRWYEQFLTGNDV